MGDYSHILFFPDGGDYLLSRRQRFGLLPRARLQYLTFTNYQGFDRMVNISVEYSSCTLFGYYAVGIEH